MTHADDKDTMNFDAFTDITRRSSAEFVQTSADWRFEVRKLNLQAGCKNSRQIAISNINNTWLEFWSHLGIRLLSLKIANSPTKFLSPSIHHLPRLTDSKNRETNFFFGSISMTEQSGDASKPSSPKPSSPKPTVVTDSSETNQPVPGTPERLSLRPQRPLGSPGTTGRLVPASPGSRTLGSPGSLSSSIRPQPRNEGGGGSRFGSDRDRDRFGSGGGGGGSRRDDRDRDDRGKPCSVRLRF